MVSLAYTGGHSIEFGSTELHLESFNRMLVPKAHTISRPIEFGSTGLHRKSFSRVWFH